MTSKIRDLYFDWLLDKVCDDCQRAEYEDLLSVLYFEEFTWSIERDENRAVDGLNLRNYFRDDHPEYSFRQVDRALKPYCSMLEMMVALAIRCEDEIMNDPDFGDRTGHWFWTMIDNLELDNMDNEYFNEGEVLDKIDIFLSKSYRKDGSKGALFSVPNSPNDFRKAEIWYQMNWYLEYLDDKN